MTAARKRGRPPFQATPAQRRKVEELKSCGMTHDEIARAIGCHADTLEKYFGDELTNGHARRRAEVIELLFRSARKGNVTAQKALREQVDIAATARGNRPSAADETEPPRSKLGKKEEAALAAQSPDTASPLGGLMAKRMGQLPN